MRRDKDKISYIRARFPLPPDNGDPRTVAARYRVLKRRLRAAQTLETNLLGRLDSVQGFILEQRSLLEDLDHYSPEGSPNE